MKFIFNKLKAIIHSGKSYKSKVSGFSLLELLVVISIIAVLLALGISSFNTAQKKARDAKRKNDVKDVSSALEQYYSVCGSLYPTPAGASFYTSIVCGSPSISIMSTVPSDPRATPYFCPTPVSTNCSSGNYKICTILESEATSEYCILNQQ